MKFRVFVNYKDHFDRPIRISYTLDLTKVHVASKEQIFSEVACKKYHVNDEGTILVLRENVSSFDIEEIKQ